MNRPFTQDYAQATHVGRHTVDLLRAINFELKAIDDARIRRRIVNSFLSGWISAEATIELPIGLGLVEYDVALLSESERSPEGSGHD